MNYKGYNIHGRHGVGFRLVSNNTVFTFNRLAKAKEFIDGMTETVNKQSLFMQYAPQFNFELNADQLVTEGLKRGFITKIGDDKYQINQDY